MKGVFSNENEIPQRTIGLTQPGQQFIATVYKGATTPFNNQLSQIRDAGKQMSGKWVIKGP